MYKNHCVKEDCKNHCSKHIETSPETERISQADQMFDPKLKVNINKLNALVK